MVAINPSSLRGEGEGEAVGEMAFRTGKGAISPISIREIKVEDVPMTLERAESADECMWLA